MAATGDISTRYVLPPDAPLLRNLAALWSLDPDLARRIDALHPAEPYAITPAKSGKPTVAVAMPDGRSVFLHSRYEPEQEAVRLVDSYDVGDQLIFYVFGFGLGYHVDVLLERASTDAILCVIEPDLRLLRTALEARDLVGGLVEGRIEDELGDAVAVAEVDEDAVAVVAIGLDPAGQDDVLADIACAQLAAAMGSRVGREELAHGKEGTLPGFAQIGAIPAYMRFSQQLRSDPIPRSVRNLIHRKPAR